MVCSQIKISESKGLNLYLPKKIHSTGLTLFFGLLQIMVFHLR